MQNPVEDPVEDPVGARYMPMQGDLRAACLLASTHCTDTVGGTVAGTPPPLPHLGLVTRRYQHFWLSSRPPGLPEMGPRPPPDGSKFPLFGVFTPLRVYR